MGNFKRRMAAREPFWFMAPAEPGPTVERSGSDKLKQTEPAQAGKKSCKIFLEGIGYETQEYVDPGFFSPLCGSALCWRDHRGIPVPGQAGPSAADIDPILIDPERVCEVNELRFRTKCGPKPGVGEGWS